MGKIQVHITEIDKNEQPLTLHNFEEELVNFMYKKTVADSTRLSMRFYILIFFLSVEIDSKSLLFKLFDENISKFKKLNKSFEGRPKLRKNQYAELVDKAGLGKVFRNDIPFLLIGTILESKKLLKQFDSFFKENTELRDQFILVVNRFEKDLKVFDKDFKSHFIADDRTDDFGNYHDLSKSVYRTIQMRMSRQLDLTLHKYADLKEVKSQSPIDLNILQNIDFRIIIDLWNTYRLGEYSKDLWSISADFGVQPFVGLKVVQFLAKKWMVWKSINGKKNRRKKLKAKEEFETEFKKAKENPKLKILIDILEKSVLNSGAYLKKEIENLKDEIYALDEKRTVMNKKEMDKKIKALKKKLERLENIRIKTEEK